MRRRGIVAAVLLAVSLSGTATAQPYLHKAASRSAPADVSGETQLLWNQYQRAMYDSSVYQRWNVRKLRPLTADADGMVLVASLTARDGKVGDTVTAGRSGMWVTGVPEVRDICRQWRGTPDAIEMHLRQLIGLPPDADTARFLILRAQACDIFRPAMSDDVTTEYPCAVGADGVPPADCGNTFPATTTPAHYQWMATASFSLHAVPDGYPWTHLGYTYNWAPGEDRYGASEYIIRPGATAVIVDNVPPAQYCAPPAAP